MCESSPVPRVGPSPAPPNLSRVVKRYANHSGNSCICQVLELGANLRFIHTFINHGCITRPLPFPPGERVSGRMPTLCGRDNHSYPSAYSNYLQNTM